MRRSSVARASQDQSSIVRPPRPPVLPNGLTTLYPTRTNLSNNAITADVVFVHGLGGSPVDSWTHRDSGLFWPLYLLPNSFNNIRIMTYGYDSAWVKRPLGAANQMTTSQHGISLLNDVAAERRSCPTRPIIFVGHSYGGIVILETLSQSSGSLVEVEKNISLATQGTIFFGVPFRGSHLASWASMARLMASLAGFPTARGLIADLNPSSGSSKLEDLCQNFSRMLHEREILLCKFAEGHAHPKLRTVVMIETPVISLLLSLTLL